MDAPIPCPDGLSYRQFQLDAIRFCLRQNPVLVADEMGVGKTITALGTVNALGLEKGGRVLVVAPSRVRNNWLDEARTWLMAPRAIVAPESADDVPSGHALIVVNVEKLIKDRAGSLLARLISEPADVLVLDEAHRYANPKKSLFKAVYSDKKTGFRGLSTVCTRIMLLTGTPMPNRPADMSGWAAYLWPELFESDFQFKRRYCDGKQKSVQKRGGAPGEMVKVWDFSGTSNLDELNRKLQRVMVRRTKEQVLSELPEKSRQLVQLDLQTPVLSWNSEPAVTLGLTAMRDALTKAPAATLAKASAAFTRELREIGLLKAGPVVEAVQDATAGTDRKVLVFAHHRAVVDAISDDLSTKLGERKVVKLYGKSSRQQADVAVESFQQGNAQVFVGSLKAAGVGITLHAASHVIFAQPSWVPADLIQAEDRAYRLGQQKNVLVQYFVAGGTIEADVIRAAIEKLQDASQVFDRDKLGYSQAQRAFAAKFAIALTHRDEWEAFDIFLRPNKANKGVLSILTKMRQHGSIGETLSHKATAMVARFVMKNESTISPTAVAMLKRPAHKVKSDETASRDL